MKNLKQHPYYYIEYIVNKIRVTEVKNILDYGCGKGETLSYLDKSEYMLYGYEVDKDIKLEKSLRNKIKLKYGNPQDKLPYKDEMFDVVILSHVLEHVGNEKKCISEISRVLRPGGIYC